jgi:hypothetical protein
LEETLCKTKAELEWERKANKQHSFLEELCREQQEKDNKQHSFLVDWNRQLGETNRRKLKNAKIYGFVLAFMCVSFLVLWMNAVDPMILGLY